MDKNVEPLREPQPKTPSERPKPDEVDPSVVPPDYTKIHRIHREDPDPRKGILD